MIHVTVERRDQYVLLQCRGAFTLDSLLAVYDRVFEAAEREERSLALVDLRGVQGQPDQLERYEAGVYIADRSRAAASGVRIAVVGDEPFIGPRRFGETVAVNRGADGRAFTDHAAALAWLGVEP